MKHKSLQFQTVKPILRSTLERLMAIEAFSPFRLVGGTSLSLRYGHRISDDIDLFTDAEYGSFDFHRLQEILQMEFPYCQGDCGKIVSFGASYIVGNSKDDSVKLDLFYTDAFIRPVEIYENIRMASVDDIVAMKMDVMPHCRKKDFWDLNELQSKFTLNQMLDLYEEKFPYDYTREEIIIGLNNFSKADDEPNPICFRNKQWDLIKLDMIDLVS